MVRLCALPGFASYEEDLSILQSHSSMPVSVTRQEVSGDLQKPPTLDHLHFELLHDDQLIDKTVAVSNSIKGKKEAEKKERASEEEWSQKHVHIRSSAELSELRGKTLEKAVASCKRCVRTEPTSGTTTDFWKGRKRFWINFCESKSEQF